MDPASDSAPGNVPSTLWTVVLTARDLESPGRREALGRLIERYWKPAYLFIRRSGSRPEDAQDLAQSFFATLLDKNYLKYVDRERGRFRTFLFLALRHFLSDEQGRARAQKRGAGRTVLSLDFRSAETGATLDVAAADAADLLFRRDWAVAVMDEALRMLAERATAAGREAEFALLRRHLSAGSASAPPFAEVARTLGLAEAEVRKRVHRLRVAYREAILDVIRGYTDGEAEVQDELADLFGAFA